MKNKFIVIVIAGILTVGGISVAYATNRNNLTNNDFNRPIMSDDNAIGAQSNGRHESMIKIMKDNGFSDEAKAMENRDLSSMGNLMNNISDKDYQKMIGIMEDNGYGSMVNMMKSIGRENMTEIHKNMMGN